MLERTPREIRVQKGTSQGEGITAFLKTPNLHGEQVERIAAKGVHFVACAKSMRQLDFRKDTTLDLVEIVPTGVGELVKKQAQGWAYIRP